MLNLHTPSEAKSDPLLTIISRKSLIVVIVLPAYKKVLLEVA